jgi:aspartate racemase
MIEAAESLERGGADFVIICTNTMHKMAKEVEHSVRIPLLHIADATAKKIEERGIETVGLLGTKFTMGEGFYRVRLTGQFGIDVIIPGNKERQIVHDIIYEELCLGVINQSSREECGTIIQNLISNGAEGIILGCTEIPLLVKQEDVDVPLFDTTAIHAESAVEYSLR